MALTLLILIIATQFFVIDHSAMINQNTKSGVDRLTSSEHTG